MAAFPLSSSHSPLTAHPSPSPLFINILLLLAGPEMHVIALVPQELQGAFFCIIDILLLSAVKISPSYSLALSVYNVSKAETSFILFLTSPLSLPLGEMVMA